MSRLEQARKLAEIVRSFIDERGWSEREFARRSGLPPSTIQGYSDGLTFPAKENRERLATAMGLSLEELDAKVGRAPLPTSRPVEEVCRDIRLLNAQDFAIVARVVLDRIMAELQRESKP